MRKVLATVIAFVLLSTSAFGDSFNGQYVCERVFVSDGSRAKIVLKIDGNYLKTKRVGDDDSWYDQHKLIHRGKVNSFLTFVREKNTILEEVTIITKMTNTRFHINSIHTDEDDKYQGIKQAQARHTVGLCDKI